MLTDGLPDDSPQSDDNDDNKSVPILSEPANKSTPARLRAFLDAYSKTGRLRRSLETAGISHNTHYRKLASDPAYRAGAALRFRYWSQFPSA
jgi:hypothetical protein